MSGKKRGSASSVVRLTAYSAILAAILSVLIIVGGYLDLLDLVFVSVAALILYVVCTELGHGRALMIFIVSGVLGCVLAPMTSTALYYVGFFGYYPIVRSFLEKKKVPKKLVFWLMLALYAAAITFLFWVFKKVFGMTEEPLWMNILLAVTTLLYYLVFQRLMSVILLLYEVRFKKMLFGKNKKKKQPPKESDYDISKRDF